MSPRRRLAAFAAGLLLAVAVARPAAAIEIERVTSPLGIEAWLVQSDAVPVIAVEFAFRGGSALDPEGLQGLANLTTTLLDEGAGDLDSRTFQQMLADGAIQLGFQAATDAFYGSMKTVSENRDQAFDLLALALNEPRFDEEAVERMRASVLSSIRRQMGDTDWMARRVYYQTAFPGHPYSQTTRGTVSTVEAITPEDLHGFVRDRFARDGLFIGVAGDIGPDELAERLDQVFGPLPATGATVDVPDVEAPDIGRVLVQRPGPLSSLLIAQPGIDRHDPDYYAASIVNYVLGGGGFGSRLTEEVRENRGLTYGIASYLVDFDHADLWMASSSVSNENVEAAVEVITAEWRRMAEGTLTQAELDDAKTYLTGSFPLGLTSTGAVAELLVGIQLNELGFDYIDRRSSEIEAVTLEQANRVAGELLAPDRLSVIVVGDAPDSFEPLLTIPAESIVTEMLGPAG